MEFCGYTLRMRALLSWRFNIWLGRPSTHTKPRVKQWISCHFERTLKRNISNPSRTTTITIAGALIIPANERTDIHPDEHPQVCVMVCTTTPFLKVNLYKYICNLFVFVLVLVGSCIMCLWESDAVVKSYKYTFHTGPDSFSLPSQSPSVPYQPQRSKRANLLVWTWIFELWLWLKSNLSFLNKRPQTRVLGAVLGV